MRAASPADNGVCRSTGAAAGVPNASGSRRSGSEKGSRGEARTGVSAGGSSSTVMPRSRLSPPVPDAGRESSRAWSRARSAAGRTVGRRASTVAITETPPRAAAADQPPSSSSSAAAEGGSRRRLTAGGSVAMYPCPPSVTSIEAKVYSGISSARAERPLLPVASPPVAAAAGGERTSSRAPACSG
eukprot:scaffold30374_cov107-Isochrysis_galbana.AAC.2